MPLVRMPALVDHRLHLVTDSRLCIDAGVTATVARAVTGGVTVVQVRDPFASTRAVVALTRAVAGVVEGTGIPVIVNDRIDVALATGVAGVHLGQSDLPPDDARRLATAAGRTDLVIGWSVAAAENLAALAALPPGTVDYLGVGPVFPTATKPDAGAAIGAERLAAICRSVSLPVVAIGGITAANAHTCRAAGAAGVAVVSAICGQPDPTGAARAFALADRAQGCGR